MKKRNHFVDISKGLAICMVTVTHFSWESAQRLQLLFPYWIAMAVPIFMIVTGAMSAASYEKKDITTLHEMYAPQLLMQKIIRYTIPFWCMFRMEVVLEWMQGESYSLIELVRYFITGGIGVYGTYYYPVLIQLVIMIPLIYYVVKKWRYGIVGCFLVNLLLEVLKSGMHMEKGVYRLMAFRYIFAVAIGCYIHIYREKKQTLMWTLSFAVGAGYIWMVNYTDYRPLILNRWTNTSMMTILYMAPLFVLGMHKLADVRCKVLERFGKASYHIFLFQIVYYNYMSPAVTSLITNRAAALVISVAVCLAGGYGYYLVYGYVSDKWNAWYGKHKPHLRYRIPKTLKKRLSLMR